MTFLRLHKLCRMKSGLFNDISSAAQVMLSEIRADYRQLKFRNSAE